MKLIENDLIYEGMIVQNLVKHYREKLGITQAELARRVNVTEDYISMIERAERSPGFSLSIRISKELNADIKDIFFEKFEAT